jgi:peptidyl-prolyl cis-trans isomerase SurA
MNRSLGIVLAAVLVAAPVFAQQAAPAQTAAPAQSAAAAKPDSTPLDAIVGVVGDTAFTRYDVLEQYFGEVQTIMARGGSVPTRASALAVLDTVVNTMVDNMVLLAKAKEYKIDVPDILLTSKVDAAIQKARSNYPTEAAFQEELTKDGLGTPDDYRRFMMDKARADTIVPMVYDSLRRENKITPVNVTEEEVDSEYKRVMQGANAPHRAPMIQFRQLILAPTPSPAAKAAARAKAESLLVLIKGGANFEELAKKYSMDPGSRDRGGALDPVPRGRFVPEFDKVLFGPFALKPGEISPVTETAFGFHIIRVDKANPTEVTAHHILIIPVVDSADVARTQRLADSIAALIRDTTSRKGAPGELQLTGAHGVPFDSLTKKFNDYAGGEDAGLMGSTSFDGLPEAYRKGLGPDPKPGDVDVFPIPTPSGAPKFGVLQVVNFEEGGAYTLDDVRDNIRNELSQTAAIRRALDGMRKQLYIKLDMPRVHSILDDLGLPPGF